MNENGEGVCPAFSMINGKTFFPTELNDEYDLKVIAYEINPEMKITSGSGKREWINNTGAEFDENGKVTGYSGYGKRCLPLVAANTLGWQVLSDQRYEVTWNGGPATGDITVISENDSPKLSSHFGTGTVTWHVGYVFYTTKGNFMYCKGPTNHFKHGIQACEGLIETDWLPFTFTMNWMITKPNETIVFEKGEPICQLFPYPKEYVENFDAKIRTKDSMPTELKKLYDYWCHSRDVFNKADRNAGDWEGNYFKGEVHDNTSCEDLGRKHYTTIKMPKFKTQSSNDSYESD